MLDHWKIPLSFVISFLRSLIEPQDSNLSSYNFILIFTLILWVNHFLPLNPLALNLLSACSRLLFNSNKSLCFYVIFLFQYLWLHYGPWLIVFWLQFKSLLISIAFENTLNNPVSWDISKNSTNNLWINSPFLLLGVIIWTGSFLASLDFTFIGFVVRRVILLFLPSVTHITSGPYFTSTIVIVDKVLSFPVEAGLLYEIITIG